MPVHLSVKEISIDEASEGVLPITNRANIKILATSSSNRGTEYSFGVENYETIDDALETVRQKLLKYAEELKDAASKPLGGTRRSQ